jgi:hypothetical protein
MKNRDALKKMLEDIIAGKDEDAQVGFHAFMQKKIKSVIEGCDEDDEDDDDKDSDKGKDDDDKDSDSDSDKDKDDDDDDSGKPPWLKKKKVDENYKAKPIPVKKNKGILSDPKAMKNVKPNRTRKLGFKVKEEKVDEGRSTPRSAEWQRKNKSAGRSGLYGKKSNKVPTGDWDDKGRGRRGKVSEGEALGSRDKRVKSKVNSFVSKNKAKESAPGGLKKTSTKKKRDLDVSSTTDKSKNL